MSSQVIAFDEIEPGMEIATRSLTLTAEMIDAFTAVSGDDFEIHLTDEAARARGYRARVGHGLLGLALTDGLRNQAAQRFDPIASLHWDWTFKAPIYVGDALQASMRVLDKRVTSDPARGIVRMEIALKNQDGEIVQEGENTLMVRV